MKKWITFIIFIILFIGCSNPNLNLNNIQTIDLVNFETTDTLAIKSIRYVPLETNSKSLIGNIDKILINKNRTFIMDSRYAKAIFIFDNNGKFLSKIDKKGKGPGEYIQIEDFSIDEENNIYIYDNGRKIIVYKESGEFKTEYKFRYTAKDLVIIDNDNLALFKLFNYTNTTHSIGLYNFSKDKLTKFLPARKSIDNIENRSLTMNHFYKSKKVIYFNNYHSDIIYTIAKDQIIPVFKIRMSSFPNDQEFIKLIKAHNNIEESKVLIFKNIFENNDFFTFSFTLHNKVYKLVRSKKTDKYKIVNHEQFYANTSIYAATDTSFISILSPSYYTDYKGAWEEIIKRTQLSLQLTNKTFESKENINPILVIYQYKFF